MGGGTWRLRGKRAIIFFEQPAGALPFHKEEEK
jgi:hypothetical protein